MSDPKHGDGLQNGQSLRPDAGFGWQRLINSPLDRVVLLAVVGLIAAIGLVILLGDRVGVTLVRVAPLDSARSTSAILLQFSESMNRETVEARLRLEPPVAGSATWIGETISFHPDEALIPGETYQVILEKGAQSQEGREVLSEYQFSFTVAQPQVAYLYPADGLANVWISDINDPSSARQLTNSPSGIFDFGVRPDGSAIAFSERNSTTGTADIKLLDLQTGALTQLTNCVDSNCTGPEWRPDGLVIAYNRVDYNSDLGSVGTSPTRVWLLDLTITPTVTRPLFADLQVLGYSPQWSEDGLRIALFNRDEGILIYDFTDGSVAAIPTQSGITGALSPDGMRIIYPEPQLIEGMPMQAHLKLANLEDNTIVALSSQDEPMYEDRAVWSPDGSQIAIARRYLDERYTRGYQIHILDYLSGESRALTEDPRYSNGFFSWDVTGRHILMQRFPELDEHMDPNIAGKPEIWVADVATNDMTMIIENAYHPRWIP